MSAPVRAGINDERPLVAVECKDDARVAIVDGLSTMVVNGTQVKVYAWYDAEWGYVNRLADLAVLMGAKRDGARTPNSDREAAASVQP